MTNIGASIIIRTRNEEKNIRKCLEGIFVQRTDVLFEVLIVDSGSTDNTLEIASHFNCRIVKIKLEEFTYPRALNFGVKHSAGEYCVFISGDSYPANEKWLDNILKPFSDTSIVAVSGRQVPIPGLNPIEEVELLKQFPYNKQYKVLSAANCAVRKSLLMAHPFIEKLGKLDIGKRPTIEDGIWRITMESKGYKIVYNPDSVVFHSHDIVRFLRKAYWCHFYTGYALSYFGRMFYSKTPEGASLIRRIPKTLEYIKNSVFYLVKRNQYLYVPFYFIFMIASFVRVFQGYCLGVRDRKSMR